MSDKRRDPKVWIKVKRGMVIDPRHRQRMGAAIWYYLTLVDMANFDTGIVDPYKDEDMASDMDASRSWVRKMRNLLEDEGYITCEQLGPKGMRITITKWINPRGYSGEVKNTARKSATPVTPSETDTASKSDTKSDTESATESDTKNGLPSISTMNHESGISKDIAAAAAPPEPKPPKTPSEWQLKLKEMSAAIATVTGDDLAVKQTEKRVAQVAAQLLKANYVPSDLAPFRAWWYANDWRGKAGQAPTRELVLSELPRSKNGNGHKPNADRNAPENPELTAHIEAMKAKGFKYG